MLRPSNSSGSGENLEQIIDFIVGTNGNASREGLSLLERDGTSENIIGFDGVIYTNHGSDVEIQDGLGNHILSLVAGGNANLNYGWMG